MHFACIRFSLLHLEWPKPPQEKLKIPQNTTKGSTYTPVIDENTLRPELSGYTFDRIVAVSEPWIMQNTIGFLTIRMQAIALQETRRLIRDWESLNYSLPEGQYPTGESMQDVFWQTTVAGYFRKGKDETRQIFLNFGEQYRFLRFIRKFNLHNFL
jgi:hypothetical protein